jgi:hypothetical protein
MLAAEDLEAFERVVIAHEQCIGAALELPTAKSLYFSDYWGTVKSLGAWGGDFVLVTSARGEAETRRYFLERGYSVVLGWKELRWCG